MHPMMEIVVKKLLADKKGTYSSGYAEDGIFKLETSESQASL